LYPIFLSFGGLTSLVFFSRVFPFCGFPLQLKEWVRRLKEAKNQRRPGEVEDGMGGWMGKKGKVRFFVLKGGILSWYNKEQSPTSQFVGIGPQCVQSNGSLNLARGGFELTRGKTGQTLSVQSKDHHYTMTCDSPADFQAWWKAIDGLWEFLGRMFRTFANF
jgi:hypothetical protein